MHPAFRLYEQATPELIHFLSQTVLGTHGAKYQHLDTEKRIDQLENPLHLSLIRNKKILGNITFSRRGKNWYVRYFAFDALLQSSAKKSDKPKNSNSFLKKELIRFFQDKLSSGEVECFYAYIDPKNDKSHFLATELGFVESGELITQTYSRLRPLLSARIEVVENREQMDNIIRETFSHQTFFYQQNNVGKMYLIRDKGSNIIAFAFAQNLAWKLHRLPGKMGSFAVKLIPYIPVLSSLIQPKDHKFIGVDKVWVKENNPDYLDELFSSILAAEKHKLILWWCDPDITKTYRKTNWGIMHALLKSSPVQIYTQSKHLYFKTLNAFQTSTDFS